MKPDDEERASLSLGLLLLTSGSRDADQEKRFGETRPESAALRVFKMGSSGG